MYSPLSNCGRGAGAHLGGPLGQHHHVTIITSTTTTQNNETVFRCRKKRTRHKSRECYSRFTESGRTNDNDDENNNSDNSSNNNLVACCNCNNDNIPIRICDNISLLKYCWYYRWRSKNGHLRTLQKSRDYMNTFLVNLLLLFISLVLLGTPVSCIEEGKYYSLKYISCIYSVIVKVTFALELALHRSLQREYLHS